MPMKILLWMMILIEDERVLMELNYFLGISVLLLIELKVLQVHMKQMLY